MPVLIRRDPFDHPPPKRTDLSLLIPQVRVLKVLVPPDPSTPKCDWPMLNREYLGARAGFTATSGTLTRVLNGIRPYNKTTGTPHPGLLQRGMIELVMLEVEDTTEANYRATDLGIRAYRAHIEQYGNVPPVKAPEGCTNTERGYKCGENEQGADRYGRKARQ